MGADHPASGITVPRQGKIVVAEPTDGTVLGTIIAKRYAPDLDDVEIEKIGRDPFLIAAALIAPDRAVVTREDPSPKKQRVNRKVPDVCDTMGVAWIYNFELWRRLDFRAQ